MMHVALYFNVVLIWKLWIVGFNLVSVRVWFWWSELMLMGFISLLLTVTQNGITKICVHSSWYDHLLPCGLDSKENKGEASTSHFQTSMSISGLRHLLAEKSSTGYCTSKVLRTSCVSVFMWWYYCLVNIGAETFYLIVLFEVFITCLYYWCFDTQILQLLVLTFISGIADNVRDNFFWKRWLFWKIRWARFLSVIRFVDLGVKEEFQKG